MKVISTCRPGARVKGTRKLSRHSYGGAIDFKTTRKKQALQWLIRNHNGGIMTYRNSSHIHIDNGPRFIKFGA